MIRAFRFLYSGSFSRTAAPCRLGLQALLAYSELVGGQVHHVKGVYDFHRIRQGPLYRVT